MNTFNDDRQAFRILAELYAQAADRNQSELMDAVMAEDAVIEGPGFRLAGRDAIRAIPGMVRQRYRMTRHVVENQVITVDCAQAQGETYCTVSHLYDEPAAGPQVLVWHLRYLDRFVRTEAGWRFAERRLVIDWTETRSVTVPGD